MTHTFDPINKTWISRLSPPTFEPGIGLGQLILEALSRNSSQVLQIDFDTSRRMTGEEMRTRAIRVAQNLASLGVRTGDMAALVCQNSENVAPIVLGMMIAGVPFICLSVSFTTGDLNHLIGLVQPKLVICDDSVYQKMLMVIDDTLKTEPLLYVVETEKVDVRNAEELLWETGREAEFVPEHHGDMRERICTILCTSGTTGRPKGVCVSQASAALLLRSSKRNNDSDVVFGFSPLYWASGMFVLVTVVGSGMTRVITRSSFDEDVFFDIFEQYKVTDLYSPPAHAVMLMNNIRAEKADLSSIKNWYIIGGHASSMLRKSMEAKFPRGRTSNNYGCSEVGLLAEDVGEKEKGAVGRLAPHLNAKIVNADGVPVAVGEQGELVVQTMLPFMGYYKDDEATRALIDEDGWIRTGDVVYLDEEEFVYLVDRIKVIFKYRGTQISPTELETIIEKIDGVGQACVVGIPEMEGSSEMPAAVVTRKDGDNVLTEEIIMSTVAQQVPDYKRLRGGVYIWQEMPLTTTGKVLRRVVREKLIQILELKALHCK